MEQNTKNALFSALKNEAPQYYNVIYGGSRTYLNKEKNTTSYIYSVIFADFEKQTTSLQDFYLNEALDVSKLEFLTPCRIGVRVTPGSKYSTLVSIEPVK